MHRGRYVLGATAALSGAVYADDTLNRGGIINRAAWTVYAAAGTFVDYKFVLTYTEEPLDSIHLRVARRWLRTTQVNGGLFSKLAQNVASMNHVLPPPIIETMSVIQDHAPTVDFDQVARVFREEFNGLSPDDLFDDFEREAVASASIAQVHRAKIKGTDQKVAVKVQKPKIAKQIDADLFLYRVTAQLIEYFFELPIMWGVPYISAQLRQEVDFRIEAANAKMAAQQVDPSVKDFVHIPRVFDELSTKRVLVCEWIDGVRVTDAKAIRAMGLDVYQTMEVVTKVFAHQLFITGHLHADPHPGNILVRKLNGKLNVVVLDHGLYCDLPEAFRKQYAQLWQAIIVNDFETLKKIATGWGIRDSELFASFQLFRPYSATQQRPALSGKVSREEALALQRAAKERVVHLLADASLVPPELTLIGRNLNLVRSLNKALNSPVNRPKLMAIYAHRGALDGEHTNAWFWGDWSFRVRLLGIDAVYSALEWWRALNKVVFGRRVGGFEDLLEKEFSQTMENKLGLSPQLDA